MKLSQPHAQIFIPDSQPLPKALERITHLGIGAHPDDLEFMAFHGILNCYEQDKLWFGGVTCSDGAGSPRAGAYATCSDADMVRIRQQEQCAAAQLGQYGVILQLGHTSSGIKNPADGALKEDLKKILIATQPKVIYTHNPADKHETHVAVLVSALQAIRELPPVQRPQQVIGCEVWRDLDWLPDAEKILLDVSAHAALASELNGVFQSQIAGGKRYDLAIQGRRTANATFGHSHQADKATQIIIGLDLTPLVQHESLDLPAFVNELLGKFQTDVLKNIQNRWL